MSDKSQSPAPPALVGNQSPAYLLAQDQARRELAALINRNGKPPSSGRGA